MYRDVKSALARSADTLPGDIAGATALVVMLVALLALPGLT